ncbi:hypothetical protein RDABS01_029118 [Bienertia sinuspersici]
MPLSWRWSFLLSFSLLPLCFSHLDHPSVAIDDSPDVHDILTRFNLPKGILPNAVKSYSLSSQDGSFTVKMKHPCYVSFPDDQIVYYDKLIKGKLSFGRVSHVSGIQAKKLFVWLPVTGMEMDMDSDMVEFYVGAFSQKLPANQFQTVPSCMNKGCTTSSESALKLRLRSFGINYDF